MNERDAKIAAASRAVARAHDAKRRAVYAREFAEHSRTYADAYEAARRALAAALDAAYAVADVHILDDSADGVVLRPMQDAAELASDAAAHAVHALKAAVQQQHFAVFREYGLWETIRDEVGCSCDDCPPSCSCECHELERRAVLWYKIRTEVGCSCDDCLSSCVCECHERHRRAGLHP